MKKEHEKHEDPKDIEAILKSELEREAREILAEIEADESLQGLTMPDEAEEALMQRIRKLEEEKAAYEQLSEKDKEALRLGREMQIQKENKMVDDHSAKHPEDADGKVVTFKKKKRRTYLLIALVAVLVMMVGMTAVGEVPLVTELTRQILGSKELTNVDSERGDETIIENTVDEDAKVYEEIKETFHVDIIKLDKKPDETRMIDYEIDEVLNRATIIYQCGSSIMEYQMIFNYLDQSYGYMVGDEILSEETFAVDDILIQLQKYKVNNSDEIMYIAQYVYQDVQYIFNVTTTLPKEEVDKILKNIKKF